MLDVRRGRVAALEAELADVPVTKTLDPPVFGPNAVPVGALEREPRRDEHEHA